MRPRWDLALAHRGFRRFIKQQKLSYHEFGHSSTNKAGRSIWREPAEFFKARQLLHRRWGISHRYKMAEANAFSGGADFIFFGPPSPSQAGPSRSRSHSRSSSAVPKGKKRKAADAVDAADGGGKKKGKENKKEGKHVDAQGGQKKKKDKGKGKARSNDANGIQSLSEDGATGPRNLKEERRAAERGCPWVDMVDWERCGDPAEM